MSDGGHAVWIVIRHQPYRIANCEIVAVARVDPSHAIFSSDAFAACAASAVGASQVSSSVILPHQFSHCLSPCEVCAMKPKHRRREISNSRAATLPPNFE
jgi:hypothetical protein